jgi:ABC-type transport system involved in cytochrome c biogenesis permease subunit|uniref:Cytochrome c biogenesis protein CcsA n=2 Tax=Cyanidioschyzon merolae TaxID=45157 RepID=Q85G53_CYAM1|nr:cytochrome c biogenesis protein [Cyanidioschyzon merolae strain 10D]API65566.1 cytochrome c biogenesis protein [Transformation vector pCCATCH]QFV16949.1 cytochrome c biogenesis protein [Cyanidioschyzon merolae]QFV17128.1 cytochrome c biogenesis protein [Cyanidioschyzon merolae]BAC76138.1 cytochrome c biogenesis protein [Cyanidioschyzon merolae strain 10D]
MITRLLLENQLQNFVLTDCAVATVTCWANLTYWKKPLAFDLAQLGMILGNLCLGSLLMARTFHQGFLPLSNLYESLLFLAWCLSFVTLALQSQWRLSIAIGTPLVMLVVAYAHWALPAGMQLSSSLVPSLRSHWLTMHVSVMIMSYASLMMGCLLALVYLSMSSHPHQLEELSYQSLRFGFICLTLGMISGAVWANEAWGSYWSWDPKETWALITWLVFAAYLHTRRIWHGTTSAFLACVGFVVIWICYLGVNWFAQGLHSYGWFVL